MPQIKNPGYPINNFVESLWYCKSNDFSAKVTTFPLLNESLIIDFSSSYKAFDKSGSLIAHNKTVWFAGMHNEPMYTEITGEHEQFGILFKPGGIYKFFGIPATEFANKLIDAEHIISSRLNEILDMAASEKKTVSKLEHLEYFLQSIYSQNEINQYYTNLAAAINDDNLRSGGIKYLLSEIKESSKTFISNFKKYYGITPKKFCQLKLINNSLTEMITYPERSLTEIALNNGFYDQSHYIKHFKSFLNITPKEYIKYISEQRILKEFPNFLEH